MERQHSSIVETPGSPEEIQTQLQIMDRFLATGRTRNLNFRVAMLERLSRSIHRHEEEILEALPKDLGKSTAEGYTTEVGILYENIRHFQKNLHFYARRKPLRRHKTNFLSQGYLYKEPYGKVLVISSFNYPFQLALEPLIGAIAAGNTVVLKPSDQAGYTEAVLQKVLAEA
jgi:aldehyde dehydrogenase (NAD+)